MNFIRISPKYFALALAAALLALVAACGGNDDGDDGPEPEPCDAACERQRLLHADSNIVWRPISEDIFRISGTDTILTGEAPSASCITDDRLTFRADSIAEFDFGPTPCEQGGTRNLSREYRYIFDTRGDVISIEREADTQTLIVNQLTEEILRLDEYNLETERLSRRTYEHE